MQTIEQEESWARLLLLVVNIKGPTATPVDKGKGKDKSWKTVVIPSFLRTGRLPRAF